MRSLRFVRLANHRDGQSELMHYALGSTQDRNIFNPTVLTAHDTGHHHVAYRAYDRGTSARPFHAFYLVIDARGRPTQPKVSLTEHAKSFGVPVVADPKLFRYGNELYATFNSGHSDTSNDLYVMRISPDLGAPQLCHLADRQPVEKNWGFFAADDGLRALYSVSPLVMLRVARGHLGSGDLHFERLPLDEFRLRPVEQLTIGTQPVVHGDDLLLIAHHKVFVRGRRGYIGRALRIRDARSHKPSVTGGSARLIHSIRALVPPSTRHNRKLLFATYFSGLDVGDSTARLAYGINDLGFGFAELDTRTLWQ